MRDVRGYLTAIPLWVSLLVLSSCKGTLSWISLTDQPFITNVQALGAQDTTYNSGSITIRVTFSEKIYLDSSAGNPTLELNTSASAELINCATITISGSPRHYCDFRYDIQSGHNTALLDYVSTNSLELNGATIRNERGNNLNPKLPRASSGVSLAQSGIKIDTAVPTISDVFFNPSSGSFGEGSTIEIIVVFNEAISAPTAPNLPTITLSDGTNSKTITYSTSYSPSLSDSRYLIFEYQISTGDNLTGQLSVDNNSISGVISDIAGNQSNSPNFPTTMSIDSQTVLITPNQSTAPVILSVKAQNSSAITIGEGQKAYLVARFNQSLSISNPLQAHILLNADYSGASASYSSYGANASELVFEYTVGSGHSASSLNYRGSSSSMGGGSTDPEIIITQGTIENSNSSSAVLTLPENSNSGSLLSDYAARSNTIKIVPYAPPPAITSLSIDFVGENTPSDLSDDTGLKLSWAISGGGSGWTNYKIERKESGSSNFSTLSTTSSGNEYFDANLSLGKTYDYRVTPQYMELTNTGASSSAKFENIVVSPAFGSAASNWNDYASISSSSAMSLQTGLDSISIASSGYVSSCAAASNNYRDCIHGGERKAIVLYGVTQEQCESTANPITVNEFISGTAQGIFNWSKCYWLSNYSLSNPVGGDNPPSSVAVIYANGFKEGKGLRNLIGNSGAWKELEARVVVGAKTYTSPLYDWWTNPIAELPDNEGASSANALSDSGKIYVLKNDAATSGYRIAADKISIVTLGSTSLAWDVDMTPNSNNDGSDGTNLKSVLFSNNKKFLWFEAKVNAEATANTALLLGSAQGSRIHNTTLSNTCNASDCFGLKLFESTANTLTNLSIGLVGAGVLLDKSHGNLFKKVQVVNSTQNNCILLDNSDENVLTNVSVSNCKNHGLEIFDSENNNLSQVIAANANVDGIKVNGSYNTLSAITVANNAFAGLRLSEAPSTIVHSVLAVHNGSGSNTSEPNISITGSNSQQITMSQIASFNNPSSNETVNIELGAGSVKFVGNITNENGQACRVEVDAGDYPGIENLCTIQSTAPIHNSSDKRASTHRLTSTTTTANFFGASTGLPTAAFSPSSYSTLLSPVDYMQTNLKIDGVVNIFRTWGHYDSFTTPTWPDDTFMGSCESGDKCITSNWRLSASSSADEEVVRNTTNNGAYSALSLTHGSACPAPILNSTIQTSTQDGSILYSNPSDDNSDYLAAENAIDESICDSGSTTGSMSCDFYTYQKFHKLALEIMGDFNGDDDGLCENGERCFYMPNFGAYQGHGTLSSCNTTTNTQIKSDNNYMLFYETNGEQ